MAWGCGGRKSSGQGQRRVSPASSAVSSGGSLGCSFCTPQQPQMRSRTLVEESGR